MGFILGRAASATWEPVTVSQPFSARSLTQLDINARGWNYKGGLGKNYSYETLSGGTSRFEYFTVTFKDQPSIDVPGGSVYYTGGMMVWIW
ncbi:MAG: hypothetical protein JNJ77_16070 [Planctomycetia bacterium]|nr:hypothetical protein [Planctomycetia bacterium]